MTKTTHGHHIPNSPTNNEMPNTPTARCGGPGICPQCSVESAYHINIHGADAEE